MIDAEKAAYPVIVLCRALGVTRQGYYAWLKRDKSSRQRTNEELSVRIVEIFKENRGTYGCPRIQATLRSQGHRVSRQRVARLMRQQGLRARRRKRWTPKTTDSNHRLPVAPNLLDRVFERTAPNQAWVGDITYVRTDEGWLYLATLLDLYSRKVVGWSMSDRIDRRLALSALEMATINRQPGPGLIHHTDRGTQYASGDYRKALEKHGMIASMSRKGNCWDNAVAESFFSTLKTELAGSYKSHADARRAIFEYIEVFYNRKRRHSSIGYVSPTEFEERFNSEIPQCA
jgi:transposase InsO family protein